MPITDLTNTTWIFFEDPDFSVFEYTGSGILLKDWTLNFKSGDGKTYSRIAVNMNESGRNMLQYGYTSMYNNVNLPWKNYLSRMISITGGTGATDSLLISFLETSAEQVFQSYRAYEDDIKSVADAIRTKGGTSAELIFPSGFVSAINAIPTGGGCGGDISGIIDGTVVALVDNTATKVRPEFASIAKKWNYRNLPSGYTQVEYIESHGTEYIDTGVIMDTTTSGRTAQMTFMYTTRGVSTVFLGARLNSTNLMYFLSTYYGTPYWNYTNKSGQGANLAQNRVYYMQTELRNGWQSMQIDGAGQAQGTNGGTVESTLQFYLFANNNNGTADSFVNGRIYDCVIRNGNQASPKLCDLVPCREEATGLYGLYDMVTNAFLSNQGSGAFTGGRDVPNFVYGYTSIDLAVTEIGDYAFYNNDLATVTLRANQIVTLGDNALYGCPISHIYVPSALVNSYKADAQWSAWANKISAI